MIECLIACDIKCSLFDNCVSDLLKKKTAFQRKNGTLPLGINENHTFLWCSLASSIHVC